MSYHISSGPDIEPHNGSEGKYFQRWASQVADVFQHVFRATSADTPKAHHHAHTYMHACWIYDICTYTYTNTSTCVYICIHTHVSTFIHRYEYMDVYDMNIYIYIYILYMYIYIYKYIYIYILV